MVLAQSKVRDDSGCCISVFQMTQQIIWDGIERNPLQETYIICFVATCFGGLLSPPSGAASAPGLHHALKSSEEPCTEAIIHSRISRLCCAAPCEESPGQGEQLRQIRALSKPSWLLLRITPRIPFQCYPRWSVVPCDAFFYWKTPTSVIDTLQGQQRFSTYTCVLELCLEIAQPYRVSPPCTVLECTHPIVRWSFFP